VVVSVAEPKLWVRRLGCVLTMHASRGFALQCNGVVNQNFSLAPRTIENFIPPDNVARAVCSLVATRGRVVTGYAGNEARCCVLCAALQQNVGPVRNNRPTVVHAWPCARAEIAVEPVR
jgi:hypothetical protein